MSTVMGKHDSQVAPFQADWVNQGWHGHFATSTEVKGEESDMVRMLKRFLKGDNRVHIVGSWGM